MSRVFVQADDDDKVLVQRTEVVDDYRVRIGEARLYLPRAIAEKLRDALTAALSEQEERQADDLER